MLKPEDIPHNQHEMNLALMQGLFGALTGLALLHAKVTVQIAKLRDGAVDTPATDTEIRAALEKGCEFAARYIPEDNFMRKRFEDYARYEMIPKFVSGKLFN
jgi:hypothetical protein